MVSKITPKNSNRVCQMPGVWKKSVVGSRSQWLTIPHVPRPISSRWCDWHTL